MGLKTVRRLNFPLSPFLGLWRKSSLSVFLSLSLSLLLCHFIFCFYSFFLAVVLPVYNFEFSFPVSHRCLSYPLNSLIALCYASALLSSHPPPSFLTIKIKAFPCMLMKILQIFIASNKRIVKLHSSRESQEIDQL